MAAATELLIRLRADGKQAVREFSKVQGGMRKLQQGVSRAAKVGVVAVAGLAAAGIKEFASFEKGMNEVFTLLPGISKTAMDEMSDQVKDLATDMGVLPDDVVPALYQALSAGVPSENVFAFLETAVETSVGGVTDLETAVDGLTTVTNAYGIENISAQKAADILFTTVKLGKTTVGELSKSLFQVVPAASATGISFEEVGSAMATITAQGVPTRVAATQLRQVMVELGKSGTIAFDAFKEASGQTFPAFIEAGGSLSAALQIMQENADTSGVKITDMFGSIEAGMGATVLVSETGSAKWASSMDEMASATGAVGEAFEQMDQGVARSWDRIQASISVALIEIGEVLAPIVEAFLTDFGDKIPGAMEAFGRGLETAIQFVERAVGGFNIVRAAIGDLEGPAKSAALSIGGIAVALALATASPLLAALAALALVLSEIGGNAQAAETFADVFATNMAAMGDASTALTATFKNNIDDFDEFQQVLGDAGLSVQSVVDAMLAGPSGMRRFTSELLAARDAGKLSALEFQVITTALGLMAPAVEEVTGWVDTLARAERAAVADTALLATAADTAGVAIDGISGPASEAERMLAELGIAFDDTSGAADDAADSMVGVADAALKLASPTFAAASAVSDLAALMEELGDRTAWTTDQEFQFFEQQLRTNAAVEAFNATDMDAQLRLVMDTLGKDRIAAQEFLVQIGLLDASAVDIPVAFNIPEIPDVRGLFPRFMNIPVGFRVTAGGQAFGHAGGIVPGSPGQEISTILKAGETVLPTHLPGQSKARGMAGDGGVTIVQHVAGSIWTTDELLEVARQGHRDATIDGGSLEFS